MLKTLFSINFLFALPITASAMTLSESALSYKFTITEQVWLLEHEQQSIEIVQTMENETQLAAYQELIYIARDLLNSVIFQASIIGLFVIALIIFSIVKPRILLHPFILVVCVLCILFATHIYQQLAMLRIHAENLRYYFLLFTT